jgi:hypothetical protein
MSSVRDWAAGSVVAALILFSPVIAFLMVITAETVIDLVMEAGTTADCALAAGAITWVLYRKSSLHRKLVPQWEPEEEPGEAAIAAPSV